MPGYNVASGAILEAVIGMQKDGQAILNVSHWKLGGVPAPQNGVLLMNSFNTLFNVAGSYLSDLANVLPAETQLVYVSYQWIFPTRYTYRTYTPVVVAGGVAQPSLPANVCLGVERNNDFAGKHNRGQFHIGPVPTTFVNNSSTTAAATAAYAPFLASCCAQLTSLVEFWDPILFNKADPAASKVTDHAVLRTTSRVLHRRTVGVGI